MAGKQDARMSLHIEYHMSTLRSGFVERHSGTLFSGHPERETDHRKHSSRLETVQGTLTMPSP